MGKVAGSGTGDKR